MLAKAPPAISFEFRRTGVLLRLSLLFKNGVRISCNNDNTSNTVRWRTRTGARVLVVARAGYKRRKMETPGAYELIDDETGEKFIVWGGNDDEDNSTFSVPSKVILQWKPSDSKIKINKNRSASPATDSNSTGEEEFRKSNSNIRAAANKSSAASFGRLKVQRVLSNCRLMSMFGVPFRSMVATGSFRQKTQLESLRQELDVLIATPGRFTYLVKDGFLHLTNLT